MIEMLKAKVPQSETAKNMHPSSALVNQICGAFAQEGGFHDAHVRLISSLATMREEDMIIVAACAADSFQTAKKIRNNLSLNASQRHIRRRIEEAGP